MAVKEPHWLTGETEIRYERHEDTGPRLDNTKVRAIVNMPSGIDASLRAQFHQRGMDALAGETQKSTPDCVGCESVTVDATREASHVNFEERIVLRAKCKQGRCNKRLTFKIVGPSPMNLPPVTDPIPAMKSEQIIVRKPDVPETAVDAW